MREMKITQFFQKEAEKYGNSLNNQKTTSKMAYFNPIKIMLNMYVLNLPLKR